MSTTSVRELGYLFLTLSFLHTVYAEKPDRSYINVRKKLHKRVKKYIFWCFTLLSLTAVRLGFACSFFLMSLLVSSLIFLGLPDPDFLGMMGLMGFLLAKARILLKADSDNLSCDLMVLSCTLAPRAPLQPSWHHPRRFFLTWCVPLPSCYWLGKCERFYFIETAAR